MTKSRKKLAICIVVLACCVAPFSWAVAGLGIQASIERAYVPGELLVKYKSSVRAAALGHSGGRLNAFTLRRFKAVGIHHERIPEDMTVEEALEICEDDPDVEYAEPNYVRQISAMPDDLDFGVLWGLNNTGQTGGLLDADIDAVEAWGDAAKLRVGSKDVVVAVLDTGADLDHEDLTNNIWRNTGEDWVNGSPGNDGMDNDNNGKTDDYYGWNFVNSDNNPDDDNGHGTHVSGTIGAEGDNGTGITGVNWTAAIMCLKTFDSSGSGSVADEIEALDYAISNGARVINASYSGSFYSELEYQAIEDARDAGILFVAAAGNGGDDNVGPGWDNDVAGQAVYPACYDLDNIISVAATNHNDTLASFSNYGVTSVDVAAPGVNIYSTKAGGDYRFMSGTSMATPHVAGLAVLIWAEDLNLTYLQVKNRILNGVDVLSSLTGKVLTAGRINANTSINLPDISIDPTSCDYRNVLVGGSSGLTVTLSNEGSADLSIQSITITGVDAAEYSQSNNCGVLAPDESCLIEVTFSPVSVGDKFAVLEINSDDPDENIVSIVLSGTGSSDADGISDNEEDGHPNGGDGNNDGTADSEQDHVTSFQTWDQQEYVCLESDDPGETLSNVSALDNPSPGDAPQDLDFPLGFFDFSVNNIGGGGEAIVIVYAPVSTQIDTYYKYGPTLGNTNPHWYEFMYDGLTGAVINGNVITLHFIDGERGDDDLQANGIIVDQGGPGVAKASGSVTPSGGGGGNNGGTAAPAGGGGGGGGGCFISTAANGLE